MMDITHIESELGLVIDSFLARLRAGDSPNTEEYVDRYPTLADQIRELLPALAIVERDISLEGTCGTPQSNGLESGDLVPWRLGDYLVLREIGRGGMGIVYEAIQQSLGRQVALKILSGPSKGNAAHTERFRLEARAAARLHHTNIVPVFDVGEQGRTQYFTMQYIRGQGLDAVIKVLRELRLNLDQGCSRDQCGLAHSLVKGLLSGESAPWLPTLAPAGMACDIDQPVADLVRETAADPANPLGARLAPSADRQVKLDDHYFRGVARIALQVADALRHAHQQGIIHRDIKPSNLILDWQGNAWITDFGLARTEGKDGPTNTGDILGTVRYMAPEQIKGQSSIGTDLYALGATLYELLTLSPPFDDESSVMLIDRVLHEEPTSPRKIDAQIPRDLEVICQRCLCKEPLGRYRSLQDVAAELRRFLAGEPIQARPISRLFRGWRWCRRNPMVAGLASLVAAALVLVSLLSLLYAGRQARDAVRIQELASLKSLESKKAKDEARSAILRLAILEFERGQVACEQGEIGPGLLHLVASWRAAAAAGDLSWQETARKSLAAWQDQFRSPEGIFSHQGSVLSVIFSPDGTKVLTSSNDSTARLWDVATAQPVGPPLQHKGGVAAAMFSPDGKRLITGSADKTAQLWDTVSGAPLGLPLKHQGYVFSVGFSPDGRKVITGGFDKTARLWDGFTGAPIGAPLKHEKEVNVVRFSPDGKTILTACDGTVQLWDAGTQAPLGAPMQHQGLVMSMVATFSPDSKGVLTSSFGNVAQIWDAKNGQPTGQRFQHQGPISCAIFSPDGKHVLTGSYDRTARLWDATTGEPIGAVMQHQGYVRAVAYSPDGNRVMTGSYDKTARIWNAQTGEPDGAAMQHQGLLRSVAFSPDGQHVITGSDDGAARLWRTEVVNGFPLTLRHKGGVSSIAYSPDGNSVITGSVDKTAQVWNASTGEAVGSTLAHQGFVYAVAFSPDGQMVLTGCGDGRVQLWDRASGKPVGAPWIHDRSVTSLTFNSTGTLAITGSHDAARIWESPSGRLVGMLPCDSPILAVAFSPDDQLALTGSIDQTARLWNVETRQPILSPIVHQGFVYSVAFSPNGQAILTGSADGVAQLWDSSSGERLGPPLKHQGYVRAVAFSPDGRALLVGCGDGTARLWETATGRSLAVYRHREAVLAATFSPSGSRVASASADKTATLWLRNDVPDDLARVATGIEVLTGLSLEDNDGVQVLDNTSWLRRREQIMSAEGSSFFSN
ncbi:MAG TPA: protein kinase [Pirellulales bacterium]|jgi:WD40 repeat protein/serine/threonine protein kinase